jgi:2-desacetyl-2-hydroxyethyl bacteriochlorophyllide A dehydrogenase
MKAIVCEQPGRFRIKEVEMPVPQLGEALVRIRRVGVCGSDLHAFQGRQPLVTYPRILGHELSGEIAAVREPARGLKAGDKVVVLPYIECGKCIACRHGKSNCCTRLEVYGVHRDGGMREYMAIPTDHLIKTAKLDFDRMAMVECLAIGAHAVRRSQVQAGEFALVVGAGPIGMGTMQFAKVAGAKVIMADLVPERLKFCRERLGADHTVQVRGDWGKEVEALTNGEYPLAVYDATGNLDSMNFSFNLVAHGGVLVMVGLAKGDVAFSDPDFHRHELTVMSSRNATCQDLEHVLRSVEGGKVDAASLITHHAALDQVIERFESWLRPETGVIKAVIEI